jgi:hypothetical protein
MKRCIIEDKNNIYTIYKENNIFSKIHKICDKNQNIIYEGELKDNKKHGIGIYHNFKLKNNKTGIVNYINLKGFFIDDKLVYGYIYDLNNVLIYQGNFQNNIPNGSGLLKINFKIKDKDNYYFNGIIKDFNPIGIGTLYDFITKKKLYDVDFQNKYIRILNTYSKEEDIEIANILISIKKNSV